LIDDFFKGLEKKFYTVSELTSKIKNIIEDNFFDIFVVGEISNLSVPSSGHYYFTLKDSGSSIKAILFKSQKMLFNFNLKNGDKILVRGRLSLYEPRGEYNIIVDYIEPFGVGQLFLKIEMLKSKLFKEGLFDNKFKKPIPLLPSKIAIITSSTGAAIMDILNILGRRFSGLGIYIYNVKVQGSEAAQMIVKGINFINNEFKDIDVIILSRGGGTLEDLMPFNEEIVARAIFTSKIPIITAIGHETDFTIADMVADLRAPTPSAAAEMVVKSRDEITIHIDQLKKRLIINFENKIKSWRYQLLSSEKKLQTFYFKFKNLKDRVELSKSLIVGGFKRLLFSYKSNLNINVIELKNNNPLIKLEKIRGEVNNRKSILIKEYLDYLKNKTSSLVNIQRHLHLLSPLNILKRGYAIVYKDIEIVKSIEDILKDQMVDIRVADGTFEAEVKRVKQGQN